jgi:perosamine synthetase
LAVSLRNQGRDGGTWLSHARLGFNYRLDDMSAAIGCSQMARIDDILAKRARVAQSYTNRLSGVAGVRPPVVRPDVKMSWFVYVITLDAGVDGEAVIEAMEKRGVPARAYFTPIHTQQYMQGLVAQPAYDLPVTDATAGRTIALPFYNNLSDEEIDVVARALEESICARPTRKPVP